MAGQSDTKLFTALARVAERHVGDFKPQELSKIAWAFAMVGRSDAQLFPALVRATERGVRDFKPQELANIA